MNSVGSRKKGCFVFVVVFPIFVLHNAGCNRAESNPAETVPAVDPSSQISNVRVPVRVETVGKRHFDHILTYTGVLKSNTEVTIFSQVADRILHFPFENGDQVTKGQVLARIRADSLQQALEQMGAEIESLDAQIANTESEMERGRELFEGNVITKQNLDQIQTNYLATIAKRKALLASKNQISINAGNASIKAPISGIVANRRLKVGDMASPQIALCSIMSLDPLKIDLNLADTDVSKVHLGQEVVARLDAYPGHVFGAKLTRILPYVDPESHTNTVEVTLPNPMDDQTGARRLKPGMYARVEILVDRRDGVLVAPEHALLLSDSEKQNVTNGDIIRRAFVVEGEIVKERVVRLGPRDGSFYEVFEGLNAGDRIVVRGQHSLADKQRVTIRDADGDDDGTEVTR
jgi:membrane fusion protein (multidrug efflux system)